MDFLGQVSLRFVDEVAESDEDNDAGGMFGFVGLPSLFSAIDNFTPLIMISTFSHGSGDNLMSMLLKPSYTAQESKEVLADSMLIYCLQFKIMMCHDVTYTFNYCL